MSRRNSTQKLDTRGVQGNTNGGGDSRGNPRNDDRNEGGTNDAKDREIRELKTRLLNLENEQVVNHLVPSTKEKNDELVQRQVMDQNPTTNTEIGEMKQFLAGVLVAITEFEKKLTNLPDTGPTHSDRS